MTARLVTRMLAVVIAVVVLALAPPSAGAWGDKGHRLVGEIAKELLDTAPRAAVKKIMGSDDLATFALFLDKHKTQLNQERPGSRDWHYDDVPVCSSGPTPCDGGNCASRQIRAHQSILTNSHADDEERKFAIFVLTHLIGDIHQPLHASDNNDTGGNDIKVDLPTPPIAVTLDRLNLHSLWDTEMVERLFTEPDETKTARNLIAKFASKAESAGWKDGSGTAAAWIVESHAIAVTVTYATLPGFACGRDMTRGRIQLPQTYLNAGQTIIEEQIAKAGYRLGALLNRLLGN
jgi:hypothetical protein